MKDYREMADSVLDRVHEYQQQEQGKKAKIRTFGRTAAIAVPVIAVAAVGTFALIHRFKGNDISVSDDTSLNDTSASGAEEHITEGSSGSPVFAGDYWVAESIESNAQEASSSSSSPAQSTKAESSKPTPSSSESTAESVPDGKSGNNYGGSDLDSSLNPNERSGGQVMIAAIPKNNRVQVIGEKITEKEARDYFSKNAASLESSLAASGMNIAEIAYDQNYDSNKVLYAKGPLLFKKGYCHISYDGNTDENLPGLTVKQNFMDFHVYNAGRLIAIVTLVKENGVIYATPAFGAPWFDSFNKALEKYSGQKILFLYAGAMAYAITPDNMVIHPQGYESSVRDSGLDTFPNAYSWFYNEQCVYVP